MNADHTPPQSAALFSSKSYVSSPATSLSHIVDRVTNAILLQPTEGEGLVDTFVCHCSDWYGCDELDGDYLVPRRQRSWATVQC